MTNEQYKKDAEHNQLDIDYHDTIANEYEAVVNEPRKLSNNILFKPYLTGSIVRLKSF